MTAEETVKNKANHATTGMYDMLAKLTSWAHVTRCVVSGGF